MPTTFRNYITMFYAVIVPANCELPAGCDTLPASDELVFENIKEASQALKRFKGSRMKTFTTREKALNFVRNPGLDESFMEDPSFSDISEQLEKLTINSSKQGGDIGAGEGNASEFRSVETKQLNELKRIIEDGKCEQVEEMIWSNPRFLVTVCDSAVYTMAGPKYNACHIAARSDKFDLGDIVALILDTITNISFIKKLYPNEADKNLQDRMNHLLDSYLNTPDPRQGNTPLHFACKKGNYKVVRVLLTFEGCDVNLKDSAGRTAEESICIQMNNKERIEKRDIIEEKIRNLFKRKGQLDRPLHKDQLKKRLLLDRRLKKSGGANSDTSFSDDSFTFTSPNKESYITTREQSTLASPTSETMNKYH